MFVVTGGTSGIGRALVYALVARNEAVCVVGRREGLLQELACSSRLIVPIQADISSEAGCQRVSEILKNIGPLKALVNNAGVIEPIAPIATITRHAWRALMSTNLDAPLFLTQLLKDQLLGGRVLNIGSGAAYLPIHGWAAYCTSKAALSMLTRCWQIECPDIAFASVMPGIVDTAMQSLIRQSASMTQEKHHFFMKLKEKNQLLTTEQVADYLVMLLLETDTETFRSKEWDIYESYAEFPEE
jgi:benzil reductase ((S)-benzoin forming)